MMSRAAPVRFRLRPDRRRLRRDPQAGARRNLLGGVVFVLVVAACAVSAYVDQGWSAGDAVYMTVLTVFTVGYDEVHPIDTPTLRAITMALIGFGCTGMIFLTGALVQFITIQSFQEVLGTRRMKSQIETLKGHVVICGFGRIGRMLARDLVAANADFVVLEADPARAAEAQAEGYLVVGEDAAEESALRHAGVERARILATALPNDATNVFVTLSARALNPSLGIISRGEAPSTEKKLRQAGADHVVLPTHIGADRMAELILYPATVELFRDSARMRAMEADLHRLGLDLELFVVEADSANAGRTVAEAEREGGFFILSVEKPGGGAARRPDPDQRLAQGDGVTLLGREGTVPLSAGFARR